jgi:uncharacterized membrane protein
VTIYLIILRLVHIFAGVLWVGTAIFYFFLVEPAIKSLGPNAPKFMQFLIERQKYPLYMSLVSSLTIVAGGLLYWNTSGGLQLSWILTGPGLGFTIGSVIALAVYILGMTMIAPRAAQLSALGKEIGMAGGAPNEIQAAELEKLNRELHLIEKWDVTLLTISLIAMATARYWIF